MNKLFSTLLALFIAQCSFAQIITTIAGNGTLGHSGDGGPATAAQFTTPSDILFDNAGNLYISDYEGFCIRKVDNTGKVTAYAGTGTVGYSGDGGPATAARFDGQTGMAFDNAGNMYIGDVYNHVIRKVTPAGIISTFAGTGVGGYSGDGGPATAARMNGPHAIVFDAAGNMYITEYFGHRVRKISAAGIISTVGGTGIAGYSGDGGPATNARIFQPVGMDIGPDGSLYVSDQWNQIVRKISPAGIISTYAGMPGVGSYFGDGSAATNAALDIPNMVNYDAAGNLYIGDAYNNVIRKVSAAGIISTFSGNGIAGFSGDGGPATAAKMNAPASTRVDAAGNVYIADYANRRVRRVGNTASISGTLAICTGATATLSAVPIGGSWSSTGAGIITIGSTTGLVSGISAGTATITYKYMDITTTAVVTVNSSTASVTLSGTSVVDAGSTAVLTPSITGGTWSSSTPAIGTVSSTGIFTGISAGTTVVTYTVSGSCGIASVTRTMTVNAVCGTIISTVAGSGTWGFTGDGIPATSSGLYWPWGVATDNAGNFYISDYYNNRIRKVDAAGIIHTIAGAGAAGFSGDGGAATAANISHPVGVAVDASGNVYFADWGNNRIRKVSTAGTITTIAGNGVATNSGDGGPATSAGIQPGGVCIDGTGNLYIGSSSEIRKIDVSGIISTIAGTGFPGFSGDGGPATAASLSNANDVAIDAAGNIYFDDYDNNRIRKINTSGIISTIAGNGLAGFSGDGGPATVARIGGPVALAVNSSGEVIFGDYGNARVRKVNAAGIISTIAGTGVSGYSGDGGPATAAQLKNPNKVAVDAAGNIYVTDIMQMNVRKITTITLDPGTITGTPVVCVGATTTLSDASAGGTWSSSNGSIATVGSASGILTGVSAGNAVISYTVTNSCGTAHVTVNATVNPLPDAGTITGTSMVGVGSSATLFSSISGGTWSSSNTAVATVGSTGMYTGIAGGTAVITYTVSNMCGSAYATKVVTVNSGVAEITGPSSVCAGSSITLSDVTPGGIWSSANFAVGTINASTGVLTGIAAGTVRITYTVSSMFATTVITVAPLPALITGDASVCQGSTTNLFDAVLGGTWSSSNTSIATVDPASGIVSGISAGTVTITYTLASGCYRTTPVTVKPLPAAISGASTVCVGSTTAFTDPTTGGLSWASSVPSVATIGSTSGILAAISAGTTTLTYTLVSGCIATKVVSVTPNTSPIRGVSSMCVGSTTVFADADADGIWSSSNVVVATIGSATGIVTALYAGTTTITYSTGVGCSSIFTLTVNPLPAAITGVTNICVGATTALADATPGGAWSSSAPSIASVTSSGLVSGISAGAVLISYTLSATGCARTVTVNVSGALTPNTGTPVTCVGSTTLLSNSTPGGTWNSSNVIIATVSAAGLVTGMAIGAVNITYTISSGCKAITNVTVNPAVPVITGTMSVCVDATTALADAGIGGTWSSSNPALGSISSTGVVTGLAAGTPIISYTLANGCVRTTPVTVKPLPGAILGNMGICVDATTTVTDGSGLGWTSSTPSVATIGAASGVITGIAPGTSTITFTATNGCKATRVATVDAVPVIAPITGPISVLAGLTITLADVTPGGVWSSSNTARATVSSTGVVTGISAPSVIISYSKTNGVCTASATKTIAIYVNRPSAMPEGQGNDFSIYPNPTAGLFTATASQSGIFAVYTLEGKEILRTAILQGANQLSLSKDLAAGVYMCRFTGDDGSIISVRLIYNP